jgi:hypothetical protein
MSELIHKKIPRGRTWYNGDTIDANNLGGVLFEGTVAVFPNRSAKTGVAPWSRRAPDEVVAVLVRNVSGVNLLPGMMVTWAAGYFKKRVDGYSRTTAVWVAGVVDEHLPAAGVPTNDLFWLVVKGPTLVKTSAAADAEDVIAEFGRLVALTAAASTHSTTAGRVIAQTDAGTDTTLDQIQNVVGIALSANTTAQTNRSLLAEVNLL